MVFSTTHFSGLNPVLYKLFLPGYCFDAPANLHCTLSLWGTQISPLLPFSTLFTHSLRRQSKWSASISCVSPLFPLETCLIWRNYWPLSFPCACLRNAQFLLSVEAVPPLGSIMSWECLVAQAPLGHSDTGSFLSYCPFSNWKSVSVLHCILPNHAICIISSSSCASEIPEQSRTSVDVPRYFFLHFLICSQSSNLSHTHGICQAVGHWVIPIPEQQRNKTFPYIKGWKMDITQNQALFSPSGCLKSFSFSIQGWRKSLWEATDETFLCTGTSLPRDVTTTHKVFDFMKKWYFLILRNFGFFTEN